MKNHLLQLSLLITLSACGGGSSSSSDNVIANDDPLPTSQPANADELTSLLTTRYDSAQSYDYWQCEFGATAAYYLLPEIGALAEGVQQGSEGSEPGLDGSVRVIWEATSANSFMLKYPDFGSAFDFTELTFTDTHSMQFNGGTLGVFDCARNSFEEISTPPASNDNDSPVSNNLEGLVAMYGYLVNRISGLTATAVLAFDDGTYTEDFAGVLANGIAASRVNNPEDWGMWQGTAGTLELKEWDETSFDETRNSFQIQPGSSDQRLNKCYNRIGGAGSTIDNGSGVFTTSTFCFFENGRFTNDTAVWIQGPIGDVTTVDPLSNGQYNINGHIVEFTYGDGTTLRRAFGFTEGDANTATSIFLNSRVYID